MIYPDKGYIGRFEMTDKESGRIRLEEYIGKLKELGHSRIVAPIDGDTWHSYRLVSWTGGDAPFPMEPQNPLWYNDVYLEAGFKPLKKYRSDKFPLAGVEPIEMRGEHSFRPFKKEDLRLIYDLSLKCFDENFLYGEIDFDEFARIYQPLLPMLDPELALIAEENGEPAGFAFCFAAGEKLILKTLAVHPAHRSGGLGGSLINQVLLAGKRKGLTHAIAALMSDGNNSNRISAKYGGEKLREYTIYSLGE